MRISFDAPWRNCRRPADTNIPPVDEIGSLMVANLYARSPHAEQFGERARAKGIEISI
jgi:hypothetical protein